MKLKALKYLSRELRATGYQRRIDYRTLMRAFGIPRRCPWLFADQRRSDSLGGRAVAFTEL
jgi:hypothetical protein